ncbi:glycosyltransferase [Mycolicibacterium frederiksbergense]|uniref:glycosyltransferase n=1 Tax=Mycolicibacterium frederiksbergense TaxID=117567 RepID=UPI002473F43A|nr:glycosyltransferase [Mycolicibacterium frederiksbergense]
MAHVIHSLGAGGAETVLVDLARAAQAVGMRLVVIGLSDAFDGADVDRRVVPQLQACGATVYELKARRYDPTLTFAVARILRRESVDVVHTHLKHADLIGGVAARMAGLRSVSTLHVIDTPTSWAHRLRLGLAMRARHLASAVIALSSEQLRWYRELAGTDDRVVLLPNGVVEPQLTSDRSAVRAEIGVPDGAVLAVCVSLMRPEKGHADLLEAVRLLPAELPLVVALAGDGPLSDGIGATVESDPVLRERVRVLGFRADVADLLAASDFVVQPSLADALPTALISALAAARPIVATRVGGIPDIVHDEYGILVAPADPAALSAGISEMAATVKASGQRLAAMSKAARRRYEERFSADSWVAGLQALYQRVTDGQVGAGGRRVAMVEFPPSGGLFQFSLQLGEALARAGDDVELITGPRPELRSREPRCRVRSLLPTWHPAAGANAPEWWRRPRRAVRAVQHTAAWLVLIGYLWITRPDVVLWSEWRFPTDGWGVHAVRKLLPHTVLALVAHEPRVLVEQPGSDGVYKTDRATNGALELAYGDLDVAFVLGDAAKEVLTSTWPMVAAVHVIPHGDEGIFAREAVDGPDTAAPVALCFGTITAYKGIDTLLEAWPKVRAQVPDARLVIAGALSADVDGKALRAQAARLTGVEMNIGYVAVGDVAQYFARARCVVLPYLRSSQSGVAHLAHTLGRPVVATRVGDIPGVVRDQESGLLVEPADPDALALAVIDLLTDPGKASRLGETGARQLAAGASWDLVAERLKQGLVAVTGAR